MQHMSWRHIWAYGFCAGTIAAGSGALAVPQAIVYSGALWYDSGVPFEGLADISVELFTAAQAGTSAWGPYVFTDVLVDRGTFQLVLGGSGTAPLDAALLGSDELWVDFAVDDVPMTPRQQVLSVPFARLAADCSRLGGLDALDYATSSDLADLADLYVDASGDTVAGPLTVTGTTSTQTLRVGTAGGACTEALAGTIRFDGGHFEGCNGTDWVQLDGAGGGGGADGSAPTQAALSCAAIRALQPLTPDGSYWLDIDGVGPGVPFQTRCDMANGGWTLVYNRVNPYFTPNHMYSAIPTTNLGFSTNSTHWFIPSDGARWKWEVSVNGGTSYKALETSIPAQATATTHATAANVAVTVYANTTGASGTIYYQTFTAADHCSYGCSSSSAGWYGLVNVAQGAADQTNPGIGGHSDSCDLDAYAQAADNYTYPNDDIELYLTNDKDIQGSGAGGTLCTPSTTPTLYHYRFWVR